MRNAPNRNISRAFEADRKNALDPKWLCAYVERLKRGYLLRLEQDWRLKDRKKPFPWEIKAEIKTLRETIAILKREKLSDNSLLIWALERKCDKRQFLLNGMKKPKGHQMNYWLDYCAFWIAEKLKEKTGKPQWDRVETEILEHFEIALDAARAHKRFRTLLRNREKFMRVITSNMLNSNWTGSAALKTKQEHGFFQPKLRLTLVPPKKS